MPEGELWLNDRLGLEKSQGVAECDFPSLGCRRLTGRLYDVTLLLAIPDADIPILATIDLVDGNAAIKLDCAHFSPLLQR